MFLHLTSAWLILLLAVINAQLYNDMGAAYTDQASLYGDEDAADVGTYDNGYDAYEDEDLAHIIFSTEKLKELYSCLCMGTSEECSIHYQQDGDGWSVSIIQKNGTFEADNNDLCKYYLCSHEEVSQVITCSQETRSSACKAGVVAQFFRRPSHACCGLTCIGLFWYSVEEQISFVENVSDVESCSCLCSEDGVEDAPKVVKITTNDTQIDKYIIHQPIRNISVTKTSTETSSPMTTLSSSKTNKWTSTAAKSNSSELNPLIKSPSSDSKKDNNTMFIIIVATSVTVVAITVLIIIAVFIIMRNKRQRKLTLKTNNDKSLEAGSAPVVEPHLSSFNPATTGKSAALYSRIPSDGIHQSTTDTHKQSSRAPGFRNGVNKPDTTNRQPKNTSAVKNEYTYPNSSGSNRIFKNRTDSQPGESAGLINDGSENDHGKFKASSSNRDRSNPETDVSLRQPLLLRPEIKESVV